MGSWVAATWHNDWFRLLLSTTNKITIGHWKKSTETTEQKKRHLLPWQCPTEYTLNYTPKREKTQWDIALTHLSDSPDLAPDQIICFGFYRTPLLVLIQSQQMGTKVIRHYFLSRNHKNCYKMMVLHKRSECHRGILSLIMVFRNIRNIYFFQFWLNIETANQYPFVN